VLNKLKLVGIFLAIPLICFFSLGTALSKQKQAWNRELYKNLRIERVREFVLPIACYDNASRHTFDIAPVCPPYNNTQRLGKPLTRSGRQRKMGRAMGCCVILGAPLLFAILASAWWVYSTS
jgi:hypothetical protein